MFTLGALKDPMDLRDFPIGEYITTSAILPSVVSLRSMQSPVKNQGNLGSCVGFAFAGLMEYYDMLEYGTAVDLSEQFLYGGCKSIDDYPGEGTYPRAACEILIKKGVCEETYFPYEEKYPPSRNLDIQMILNAGHHMISNYSRLMTLYEIKNAIYRNGPVQISSIVYDSSFFGIGADGLIKMPKAGEIEAGGHAMLCVGYNDVKRCLEIKNSWGNYGDNGYLWMPYDYAEQYAMDAWAVVDKKYMQLHWSKWF